MSFPTVRIIRTDYYKGTVLLKTTRAVHSNSATLNCVNHLQLDHYKATHAEIYDENSGELHAVFTLAVSGISILFKREIKDGM